MMAEQKSEEYYPEILREKGFGWRVGVSIFIVFGWLAFLIIWLFFYANDYGVFQNIAMLLVSIIVGVGLLAGTWVSWGIRYAATHRKTHEPPMHMKSRSSRIVSGVAAIGWLIFLVVWLFFYADNYSGYQNLAIFIASLLVLGAISGSAWLVHWMRSWMKH
jgi:heme/copper-type cytochrome/quinol oxidase subunit 4